MAQRTILGSQVDPQPSRLTLYLKAGLAVLLFGGLFSGCVSSEKYEAEKARALNFQRLLAQEEKRTGELNVKYQDAQRKISSLESQTRDVNSELEALRDQLNRSHDELARIREGGSPDDLKVDEPSISEFGLDDLDFKDSDLAKLESELKLDSDVPLESASDLPGMPLDGGGEHTVSKGETLYGLSRQYGVGVDDIKSWNNLSDNTIHVGQKLIVSAP